MDLPVDTDPAMAAHQRERYRQMAPSQKLELMAQMCDDMKAIAIAGICGRHPTYSASDAKAAYLRLTLGDDLFRRAFPTRPVLGP